ncbi:MAG: transcriptional repressor LexA [Nitrososphaera sp.]|nr:transcriptional repressor LexA [Nitrososphaera sp.]
MTGSELKRAREALGLSQAKFAEQLGTTRKTINFYEAGTHRISGAVALAVAYLSAPSRLQLAGIVAAGNPIEPFPETDVVEVPPGMVGRGETFALRVKGESMRDEGILPGDLVIVHKQSAARNGQTVIALVNNEATIKTYYRKAGVVELRPANESMKPIIVSDRDAFCIEGVVVGVIRYCKK